MGFQYVDTDTVRVADGLRMVVVGGVPSPWGEAAKGLFHMKGLDWMAVRLRPGDPVQADWLGVSPDQMSAPAVFWKTEGPVSGATDIVHLVERISPSDALVPEDRPDACLSLIERCAGAGGLAWQRRLQLIHQALAGGISKRGFNPNVAAYLAPKCGYSETAGRAAGAEVAGHLTDLAAALGTKRYLLGDQVSAADVYLACTMALFEPMPEDVCEMRQDLREAFQTRDAMLEAAMDPRLLEHRDRMYRDHLETPLRL